MREKTSITLLLVILASTACIRQNPLIDFTPHVITEKITYQNPIIKGFNPDPSICVAGDDFFLVCSSFEYFPGVPLYHSLDLVNWKQVGNVLDRKSQLDLENVPASGGVFAPTIRYHNGTFYMITTNVSAGKNFIVKTEDPFGTWSEPVLVPQQNIDPSLFFDDNGKVYYTGTSPWGGKGPEGIYQAEINIETGELLTPYTLIWTGTGGRYPEGPHLYKIKDRYYLLISEGGTEMGHFVTMARSETPWGPFEACPHNPILTNRNEPFSNPVQNSGHADLIQAPDGKWWMVHLAVRNVNKHHHLGRESFLLPVEWDNEGWPVVNRNGVSQVDIYAATGAEQNIATNTEYSFETELGPEWIFLRNPDVDKYELDSQKGTLNLQGTATSLNDLSNPTFLGIRQKDLYMSATARMSCILQKDGEEAGVTAYMNNEHYYAINLKRESGRNYIVVRMKLGNIEHEAAKIPCTSEIIYLSITSTPEEYIFSWSEDGKSYKNLANNYARLISTETAGGFTGVILGMYASSNGNGDGPMASFDSFKYIAGENSDE